MFSVEINDYGLGNYRDRVIETFVTDINFKLKNRMLGEYEDFCVRVAILVDKEFDFFREPKLAVCESNSLDSYKKKLDFQSSWIVQQVLEGYNEVIVDIEGVTNIMFGGDGGN